MIITIEKKKFQLKFGFKCFLILGEALGLQTFNEVAGQFSEFGKSNDFKLDQLKLIEQLVIAAAEAHPEYYSLDYSIQDVSVLDTVMADSDLLQRILNSFASSFPNNEGNVQPRKQARKTAKK